jgi:hypothetical protein
MEEFGATKIFLHDTQTGTVTDLSEQSSYTFNKNTNGDFLQDRLYLSFDSPTGMENANDAKIFVTGVHRAIDVFSPNGIIDNIRIIDMQGRVLFDSGAVPASNWHHAVNAPGVYLVRVTHNQRVETYKVTVK